jgi:hypothetical protein
LADTKLYLQRVVKVIGELALMTLIFLLGQLGAGNHRRLVTPTVVMPNKKAWRRRDIP